MLNIAELKYAQIYKESLAIVGHKFTIYTDYKPSYDSI